MLEQQSHHLATGRHLLQLSRVAGHRIASWDSLVLTASSAAQGTLYRRQLELLRHSGRLPERMRTLVVEDPEGRRIGSGGATLAALRQAALAGIPLDGRMLLIHAGGDSKRLPWASVPGKIFIPFPLHAHPDHPLPSLIEQLLAAVAGLPDHLEGPCLVAASGDVLPLFPAMDLVSAANGMTLVVAAAPLDVACRHGVAVVGADDQVRDLLQKATPAQMQAAGAVLPDGSAWIDSGLVIVRGDALRALVRVACDPCDPVAILANGASGEHEISLYEELISVGVPARHAWLRTRPLGAELLAAGSRLTLSAWRCPDFGFVHLGTNTEFIAHCQHSWAGQFTRRLLAEHGGLVAPDATILTSRLDPGVHVGRGSVVISSELGQRTRIGNRCVVFQVLADDVPLDIPDNTCLWQVALSHGRWATLCCGTDDNPKDHGAAATFLGAPFMQWMDAHGICADEVWAAGDPIDLWHACLFPVGDAGTALPVLRWLLSPRSMDGDGDHHLLTLWRSLPRTHMAGSAADFDPAANVQRAEAVQRSLNVRQLSAAIESCADVAISPLAATLAQTDRPLLLALAERISLTDTNHVARSRRLRLRADLQYAAGNHSAGKRYAQEAWDAVSSEVAVAQGMHQALHVSQRPLGSSGSCELAARFDLAGGWSDTPPYCLERPAKVLNLAIELDGQRPIGAHAEALAEPIWELTIAGLEPVCLNALHIFPEGGLTDPYALPKVACAVMGFGSAAGISQGVRLHCWSRVPKGSGLGSSSILAAAICTALAKVAGGDTDPFTICTRVLAVEQALTTRGGWQDQLGGLLPGAKLLTSLPTRPMRIRCDTVTLAPGVVTDLHEHLVIAYTGISRLARDVLQRVVSGYLSRDALVVGGIQRLVECAEHGRGLLGNGDLAGLGGLFREVWRLHQDLDPNCSNPSVDRLLAPVQDWSHGWKLAGAGGGGFVAIMAKDRPAAERIRTHLTEQPGVRIYRWNLG